MISYIKTMSTERLELAIERWTRALLTSWYNDRLGSRDQIHRALLVACNEHKRRLTA